MAGKKTGLIVLIVIVGLLLIFIGSFRGCYNEMVTKDEAVSAAWSQVENVYQRRYDLIPNLVETVKGYAAHESETLTAVTEARARLGGQVNITGDVLNDPAAFERFQQAQGELSGALQRLMVVTENYPELKANQNFLSLQDQLEGTENRIAVERQRFNDAAKVYNTLIRKFPQNIVAGMFGFNTRPYFASVTDASVAPAVRF